MNGNARPLVVPILPLEEDRHQLILGMRPHGSCRPEPRLVQQYSLSCGTLVRVIDEGRRENGALYCSVEPLKPEHIRFDLNRGHDVVLYQHLVVCALRESRIGLQLHLSCDWRGCGMQSRMLDITIAEDDVVKLWPESPFGFPDKHFWWLEIKTPAAVRALGFAGDSLGAHIVLNDELHAKLAALKARRSSGS